MILLLIIIVIICIINTISIIICICVSGCRTSAGSSPRARTGRPSRRQRARSRSGARARARRARSSGRRAWRSAGATSSRSWASWSRRCPPGAHTARCSHGAPCVPRAPAASPALLGRCPRSASPPRRTRSSPPRACATGRSTCSAPTPGGA